MTELTDANRWSLDDRVRDCLQMLAETGERAIAMARSTGGAVRSANGAGSALAAGLATDSARLPGLVEAAAPLPARLRTTTQQWREEEARETKALLPDYTQLASTLRQSGTERKNLGEREQAVVQRQGQLKNQLEECTREEASIHDVIRQCESTIQACQQLLAQMRTDLQEIRL